MIDDDEIDADPETGKLLHVVVYGDAIFSRRCACGRFLHPDPQALVNDERTADAGGAAFGSYGSSRGPAIV